MKLENLLYLIPVIFCSWFGFTRLTFLLKGYGLIMKSRAIEILVPPNKATFWNKLILLIQVVIFLFMAVGSFLLAIK